MSTKTTTLKDEGKKNSTNEKINEIRNTYARQKMVVEKYGRSHSVVKLVGATSETKK